MLLTNVRKHLLVVPARVFFLSFSKWYVVGDTANSSVHSGILLRYLDRNTYGPHSDATRPIKLDMSCANVLLGFLRGISRVPSRLRRNAIPSEEGDGENAQHFHLR